MPPLMFADIVIVSDEQMVNIRAFVALVNHLSGQSREPVATSNLSAYAHVQMAVQQEIPIAHATVIPEGNLGGKVAPMSLPPTQSWSAQQAGNAGGPQPFQQSMNAHSQPQFMGQYPGMMQQGVSNGPYMQQQQQQQHMSAHPQQQPQQQFMVQGPGMAQPYYVQPQQQQQQQHPMPQMQFVMMNNLGGGMGGTPPVMMMTAPHMSQPHGYQQQPQPQPYVLVHPQSLGPGQVAPMQQTMRR